MKTARRFGGLAPVGLAMASVVLQCGDAVGQGGGDGSVAASHAASTSVEVKRTELGRLLNQIFSGQSEEAAKQSLRQEKALAPKTASETLGEADELARSASRIYREMSILPTPLPPIESFTAESGLDRLQRNQENLQQQRLNDLLIIQPR